MKKSNLFEFILKGDNLFGIHLNDSKANVIKTLGSPEAQVGDEKMGFIKYQNGLRYGYINDLIDELSIVFFGEVKIKYLIQSEDQNIAYKLSEKVKIHEFIKTLNGLNIRWKANDESNPDVFSILIETSLVYVLFDLETGFITKISKPR